MPASPWHFRYVGYPHSEVMENLGLCLEEYIEYLKAFPAGAKALKLRCGARQIQISYANESVSEMQVSDNAIVEVSGNNIDGCIVTVWE